MATPLDTLDRQLIELLKVNARLPMVKIAKALGCARSTAQIRLKALEDTGVISGYTVGVTVARSIAGIHAMVLISIESKYETEVVRSLSRRHEITRLYTVSGRYDLCAMLATESTQEPVSYTHLDVYKRQGFRRESRVAWCRPGSVAFGR